MFRNKDFFPSLYILLLEGLQEKSLYIRNKTQLSVYYYVTGSSLRNIIEVKTYV